MKRLIFVAVAFFLVGCNGMGSGANRFLPASFQGEPIRRSPMPASHSGVRRGEKTKVHLTMTIPKRHRRNEARDVHPSTISSLTQSVSISINGGGATVFNATPSSAACHVGPSGTVCTFVVNAPVGSDTFVIATFSGAGGGGTKLDQGGAVFNVVKGKNNTASVRLGPVVSTTADSGLGSLRLGRHRRGQCWGYDHAAAAGVVDDYAEHPADRFERGVDRGPGRRRQRAPSRRPSWPRRCTRASRLAAPERSRSSRFKPARP